MTKSVNGWLKVKYEPVHEISNNVVSVTSKASDQPARRLSLIRAFACRLNDLKCSMSVKLLTEHHLDFISLKGGCTGSSEYTLVKMPHCWKSHVTAHIQIDYHFIHSSWSQTCSNGTSYSCNRTNMIINPFIT